MNFETKEHVLESSRVGSCACLIYFFPHIVYSFKGSALYPLFCFKHLLFYMFIYHLIEFFSLTNNCTVNNQSISCRKEKKSKLSGQPMKKHPSELFKYIQHHTAIQQRPNLSSVGKSSRNWKPLFPAEVKRRG